ncbi:TNT domain-containing protein [Mucilaginibacter rubeus]|uniref:DUF4237 domain-containing protein n=1 Tax=Mucilaginibacter rubeus TaxID=2027860 RepID=A0A5C1I2L5_9SPHI|nr:TNT domain-containing protein [Mucilaginibacter rubeus]QEM12056.1 DUF4237 domain-containing protein [Mucilaginibacter rubeus]
MKKLNLLLLGMLLMPFLVNAQKLNDYTENLLKSYSAESDTSTTRGVSYQYFRYTVKKFRNSEYPKKLVLLSWTLWKNEAWGKLDTLFKNLEIKFPPNYGAISEEVDIILPAGWLIDRYGGKYDDLGNFSDVNGDFVAPSGIPFEQRSIPQENNDNKYYKRYLIKKDIHAKLGQTIPWSKQPGQGVQFRLSDGATIETLKADGSILEKKL